MKYPTTGSKNILPAIGIQIILCAIYPNVEFSLVNIATTLAQATIL